MNRFFGRRGGEPKPKRKRHRHEPLPPTPAQCELRYTNGTSARATQHRSQSCFGSQYLYFQFKAPIQWSDTLAVRFELEDERSVEFPVRQLAFTRSHTIIGGVRFDEFRFDHAGCSLIFRRNAASPKDVGTLLLRHTPH